MEARPDELRTNGARRARAAEVRSADADIVRVLDTIDLPIVVIDADCRVARFNAAASETLGLTMSDIGRLPGDLQALKNDLQDCDTLCARVLADASPCRRDVRVGDRSFILRIAPYMGADQQTHGAVLTFANVTAFRASVEQAIYEREFTKTILNAVEPLVVLDPALRVQTANRAFYDMFGVTREAAQGVPLPDLADQHWKSLGLWSSLKATLSAGQKFPPVEVDHVFSAGRRTLLLQAHPLLRVGNPLILLSLRDITERKQAEEKVRDAEQQLRDFVENATVGMHWVGPDGIILWANRTELEILGYSRDEYVGHHIAEFHADRPVIEDMLHKLASHEIVRDQEARLRRKDGSIREVLINSNVLWEGDKFIHTRCFTRDITERKQAEEALRDAHAKLSDQALHLEQLVQERTTKLQAALADLEASSYTISHDLRAPLRAMHGFGRILEEECHASLGPAGQEYLRRIINGASRMDQLIQDVLSFSRISRADLPVRPVNVHEIVRDILATYPGLQAPQADIQIEHRALPPVSANEAALTQCIANLLGNAIKFVAPGVRPRVRIWAEQNDCSVRLFFEDNGIGIPADGFEKIFSVFQRLSAKYEGTGIGLAIVRKAMERMGGKVGLESEVGKGSIFWIELKRADTQLT